MFGFFKRKAKPAPMRRSPFAVRGFNAAEVSRILAPWSWDGGFSNAEIAGTLSLIRARSRDMAKNNAHFTNYFRMFRNNVVGKGFVLKAQPCEVEGRPEIDEEAKKFLQYHFWKWATNRGEVDLTGRKSFARLCRLVAENWARDGEGIVLLERNAPTVYGLQLRVVRPDALDEAMNGVGSTGATIIRNGVEVDRRTLRPVAYYFKTSREDPEAMSVNGCPVIRVPAADVIHVFSQHDECQTRGVPLGHAVLKKGKMLDEFDTAELVAARDEANTTGVYHAPLGREGELGEYTDDEAAALTMPSEPGTKVMLEPGWDYSTVTPNHPNREVAAFKNSMLRDSASGLGVEYAGFTGDWAGVSYSSVRIGTLMERDNWQILQNDFIEMFVAPVYEAWLASFLAQGIANPYVPSDYFRLCEFEFQPRTWEWVDPLKDVNADVIAVQHGWKTNEEITAQYGGADFIENCKRIAEENKAKAEAGILTEMQRIESEVSDEQEKDK